LKTKADAESGPWLKGKEEKGITFFQLQAVSHPLTFFRQANSVHHQHEHH